MTQGLAWGETAGLGIVGVAERMRPAQLGSGDRMLRPPTGYPMDTTAPARPRLGPFLWPLLSPGFAGCEGATDRRQRMGELRRGDRTLRKINMVSGERSSLHRSIDRAILKVDR